MTFNINEFKSILNKYGGPSRNNLFTVQFSGSSPNMNWDNTKIENRDLMFFCETATFPGITLNTFDYRPNNLDLPQSMPINLNYEQVECIFILEDKNKILDYFHSWMRGVINYSTGLGINSLPSTTGTSAPQQVYELGYKSDYTQTMQITKYSKNPSSNFLLSLFSYDEKYSCTLFDAYPVQIGALRMDWNDRDSYASIPVNFAYSSFEMSTT